MLYQSWWGAEVWLIRDNKALQALDPNSVWLRPFVQSLYQYRSQGLCWTTATYSLTSPHHSCAGTISPGCEALTSAPVNKAHSYRLFLERRGGCRQALKSHRPSCFAASTLPYSCRSDAFHARTTPETALSVADSVTSYLDICRAQSLHTWALLGLQTRFCVQRWDRGDTSKPRTPTLSILSGPAQF